MQKSSLSSWTLWRDLEVWEVWQNLSGEEPIKETYISEYQKLHSIKWWLALQKINWFQINEKNIENKKNFKIHKTCTFSNVTCVTLTSRERPKSAPYLRLKNSKWTSIKVSKYSLLQYRKNPKVGPNWRVRGYALRFSSILSRIIKNKSGTAQVGAISKAPK